MNSLMKFDQKVSFLQRYINFAFQIYSIRPFSSQADDPIFNVETEEEFDEKVTNSDRPVLVDFYADWW